MRRVSRQRGLSLLEVLVALAILAFGMAAVVRTAGQQADVLRRAREHSYAQWLAANVLAETRLAQNLPANGVREGDAAMGAQRWRWRLQIAQTPVAGIQRLDVSVFAQARAEPVLTLSGFSEAQ